MLEHHPKQVTAAIAAVLLGGGGAAFGVASLDPQPDTVVVRQVLEDVAPLPVDEQLQQIENTSMSLYRTDRTRLAETVDAFLARMGVDDSAAASFLRREPTFRAQFLAHAGRPVSVESNDRHELVKFTGRWMTDSVSTFKRLVVERSGHAFVSHVETAPLTASVHLGSALVRSSLFAAADEVNVPDSVVSQMVEIFSSEIDFHRDLRLGDRFNVVYETLDADGEPMRTGRILSAEFVNAGTAYNSVWFQAPGRKGGYYTLDGKSLETSYLPRPLQYSRVSSGYSMRFHPILHQWKAHLGVDYAAPIGTPVRTVGDGKVEFAGVQNGFGNVVIVRHNATEETVYAHLSRIRVHPGEPVEQGQTIGNVGETGWATGPHLHFEFRVNGVHQNPALMLARHNQEDAIPPQLRTQFALAANSARMQLAAAARELTVASAQ